jgi:hypothetical protein
MEIDVDVIITIDPSEDPSRESELPNVALDKMKKIFHLSTTTSGSRYFLYLTQILIWISQHDMILKIEIEMLVLHFVLKLLLVVIFAPCE